MEKCVTLSKWGIQRVNSGAVASRLDAKIIVAATTTVHIQSRRSVGKEFGTSPVNSATTSFPQPESRPAVSQPSRRRLSGEVFARADEAATGPGEERAKRRPSIRVAQQLLEFENQDHLHLTGLDLAHEGLKAGPVHRVTRVDRVGVAGKLRPALVGALLDGVAADGRLTLAGVKTSADLVQRRNARVVRAQRGQYWARPAGVTVESAASKPPLRVDGRSHWPMPELSFTTQSLENFPRTSIAER